MRLSSEKGLNWLCKELSWCRCVVKMFIIKLCVTNKYTAIVFKLYIKIVLNKIYSGCLDMRNCLETIERNIVDRNDLK